MASVQGWRGKALACLLVLSCLLPLIAAAQERLPLLLDQVEVDEFLTTQLKPELLHAAF